MNMYEIGTIEVDLDKLSRNFLEQPWKRKEQPVYQDFYYLYIECNLAKEEMVKILGLSTSQITVHLRHLGIKKPKELKQAVKERQSMLKYGVKHPIAMKETREKIKKSNLEKYGTECVLTLKETHEKARATMKERYGAEHALQVEQFREKMRDTNKEHWGVEYTTQSKDVQEKMKASVREKYGVDNVFELQEFQDLAKERMKEKYGKEHAVHVEEFREKMKTTSRQRYGADYPIQTDGVREKSRNTTREHYGVDCYFATTEAREKLRLSFLAKYGDKNASRAHVHNKENFNRDYWEKHFINRRGKFDVSACAEYHGVKRGAILNNMKRFGMDIERKGDSTNEYTIYEYVKSLGHAAHRRDKKILGNNQELDIVADNNNLAIEYDGIIYHSEGAADNKQRAITSAYHLRKTELCTEKGYNLLHIFDVEWLDIDKRDIWKSIICAKLGDAERIYARNTFVNTITPMEATTFCNQNHLQGSASTGINFGLFLGDELVAVMTFTRTRFNKKYDWELVRYCCKKYTTVVGGASKLLKAFRSKHPGSIISYANRRWSDGKLYEALGFRRIGTTPPNYFYFATKDGVNAVNKVLHSRQEFQKHKLKDKLEHFDPELTEVQNMFNNGYRRIFDCGNFVYALES